MYRTLVDMRQSTKFNIKSIHWMVLWALIALPSTLCQAQDDHLPPPVAQGYLVPATIFEGDTIANFALPVLHIFKPLRLNTRDQQLAYRRLVRDVKKTLPYAKIVSTTLMETYDYLETLPSEREKRKHLKQMEKDLLKEYTPKLRKLTLNQGKLLIKLIGRETGSSSYGLIDAYLGGFSAGFWNSMAGVFGATLKVEYDPEGEDAMIERVCVMVERGYI